ncbi:hypothetical protein PoB_007588200 [Plakobranchus ocellatus]|uniref:Uncharacterized protein n=1 Tax=Plakobranchus ocellatus TaxID=259542 RepID=A0AAV4DYH9_9GAST|nr:hypothetical protein PoB_007588200 [Plakobranchus ocellatus]
MATFLENQKLNVRNKVLTPDGSSLFKFGWFLYMASTHHGDLRLSGSPSGQDADGEARTHDRRVSADFTANSLASVPPTPLLIEGVAVLLKECGLHALTIY